MRLDFNRPHAELYGVPGATFEQNGRYFRSNGEPVDAEPEAAGPEAEQPAANSKSLGDLPDRQLKVLVEQFGGEWTSRPQALQFLGSVPL